MFYTVYLTRNTINQKIYIGTHITSDPNDDYIGSGTWLRRAIAKHGRESFIKEILFVFDNPEAMFAKEAELVTEEFLKRSDTYNLNVGGHGGWDYINRNGLHNTSGFVFGYWKGKKNPYLSERLKISNKIRNKLGDNFRGKQHTEETKRKIGEANKKLTGDRNGSFGTCWITNGKENKKVEKNNLEHWINEGYVKGRKMNFKDSP